MQDSEAPAERFDYEDLEEPPDPVDPQSNAGQRVSRIVDDLGAKAVELKRLEKKVEQLKAEIKNTKDVVLPRLLRELGSETFGTANGPTVEIERKIETAMPVKDKDRYEAGIKWLENNDQGACVKYAAMVSFDKGDQATERAFKAYMEAFDRRPHIKYTVEQWVEPQTLNKVVREMLAAGVDVPRELFGVYEHDTVKITKGKK